MVQRFRRSHRLLPQRLKTINIERMERVASSAREQRNIEVLRDLHRPLIEWLERMPLAIHNPDITIDKVKHRKSEPPVATHWARWALEPIGVGWATGKRDHERAAQWLGHAKQSCADLADLSADAVWLVALVSEFERAYTAQKYRTAIKMVDRIANGFAKVTNPVDTTADSTIAGPVEHPSLLPAGSQHVAEATTA
jgi:hypothetical protein